MGYYRGRMRQGDSKGCIKKEGRKGMAELGWAIIGGTVIWGITIMIELLKAR
jgi:hypothetical protein